LLRLWKLRKKISFRRKKKNANSSIAAISNVTRAFSAISLSITVEKMLAKDVFQVLCLFFSPYPSRGLNPLRFKSPPVHFSIMETTTLELLSGFFRKKE